MGSNRVHNSVAELCTTSPRGVFLSHRTRVARSALYASVQHVVIVSYPFVGRMWCVELRADTGWNGAESLD